MSALNLDLHDCLIYELYGLTEDEVKIVDGKPMKLNVKPIELNSTFGRNLSMAEKILSMLTRNIHIKLTLSDKDDHHATQNVGS